MGQLWAAVAKGKPRKAHGYEISVFSYGKAPGFSLVKIQTKGAESRQKKKKQSGEPYKSIGFLTVDVDLREKQIIQRDVHQAGQQ